MTNPDRDELLGYADSLNQQAIWIEEALAPETPDSQRIGIEDIDIDELRGASDLFRRLASSDGGVKVRELEWTYLGLGLWRSEKYQICMDRGENDLFIVRGWDRGTNPHDTLDAAKAAAQADYEARIKSALVEVPAVKGEPVAWRYRHVNYVDWSYAKTKHPRENLEQEPLFTAPPADAGMREALGWLLDAIKQEVKFTDATPLLKRRFEVAEQALTAPGATTKSDGGVIAEMIDIASGNYDGHGETLDPWTADNRSTIDGWISRLRQPGPSDPSSTRSEVTVDVEAKIEWWLNEICECNERMWNGSRASYFKQIANGVAEIRALLDQFEIIRRK